MLYNYGRVAWRNIGKHRIFSFLNIGSLAAGLAIFTLAITYGAFNDSYESFHRHAGRLYDVVQVKRTGNQGVQNSAILPAPLGLDLQRAIPEIEAAVRLARASVVMSRAERRFAEHGFFFAEENFLRIFSFPLRQGHPETALSRVNTVVLSEEAARKYFGDTDPVGKEIGLNGKLTLEVTGVLHKLPANSMLRFDFLTSLETARSMSSWLDDRWTGSTTTFLLLAPGATAERIAGRMETVRRQYFQDHPQAPERLFLLPLTDLRRESEPLRLQSQLGWGEPYSITYFFYAMAAAGLLMVCLNFMNLATASHLARAREVGLRKVSGATRGQLIRQFLGESVLTALLALPLALLVYLPVQGLFADYMGHEMDLSLTSYPAVWYLLPGVTVLCGLLAGSYPAFFLSSFRPARVVQGNPGAGRQGALPRKILVVGQFALSIIFISFTAATWQQSDYLSRLDFGLNWQDVVAIRLPGESRAGLSRLADRLRQHPDVRTVAGSQSRLIDSPGQVVSVIPEGFQGREPWTMRGFSIDYDLPELMRIQLLTGRGLARDHADEAGLLINETAARQLAWANPVGRRLSVEGREGVIAGVVRDFIYNDVHFPLEPVVMYREPASFQYLLVRTTPGASGRSGFRGQLAGLWQALNPDNPFEMENLSSFFNDHYQYIRKMTVIDGIIAAFILLVAAIGLLGLTAFTASRKTREIGVRKTLGASLGQIFSRLFAEFFRPVVLANLLALPLAYFLTDWFLTWAFAFRPDTGISLMVTAAVLSLAMAVAAIFYHTWKAARINPVDALRHD